MTPSLRPMASIVVPMLDEAGSIEECLDGFAAQTYPKDRLEVLVVDGGSVDGSRQVVEDRAVTESWIRVIENPARRASAAFNRGVEAAQGDVIFLFSAHGVPDADFVERSVEVLVETGASGVGGRYRHEGVDPASTAVGLAMSSPFGMASPHRFASTAQDVDTISHPAYLRQALLDVGPFDESLQRNSDYELNWRLVSSGHRLVFDPSIGSVYRPRTSLRRLARQFWWYGRWKQRVIARHPGSLKMRHLVPPTAVAGAVATPVLGRTRRGRTMVTSALLAYVALVGAAVLQARPRERNADLLVLAASFPVMHIAWGSGFVLSLLQSIVRGGRS